MLKVEHQQKEIQQAQVKNKKKQHINHQEER